MYLELVFTYINSDISLCGWIEENHKDKHIMQSTPEKSNSHDGRVMQLCT